MISTSNCDILVLLFSPTGRDPEAMIPLCWYLEEIFDYKIVYGSMFDAEFLIDKYRPKALLLSNIAGSEFNVQAADYAYRTGVKVITLTAEGLFREKEIEEFIWGNNIRKKINWHMMFVWSEKYKRMTQKYLPQYKNTFYVSGSTSIDRYKIYQLPTRKKILPRYDKGMFKKVILYAGFTFGNFYDPEYVNERKIPPQEVDFYRQEMIAIKTILIKLIKENEDILFILKLHPGEKNKHMEIDEDWNFSNILILQNEETLADLINISDLLFVYRSTTTFEAYALEKPVINILPTNHQSYNQEDQQGNVNVKSFKQAQHFVNELYETGEVKSFENKAKARRRIIQDSIGSDDGLNSWRTANQIKQFMDSAEYKSSKGKSLKGGMMHFVLMNAKFLRLIPRFRSSNILENYIKFNDFYKLKKSYEDYMKKFYTKG